MNYTAATPSPSTLTALPDCVVEAVLALTNRYLPSGIHILKSSGKAPSALFSNVEYNVFLILPEPSVRVVKIEHLRNSGITQLVDEIKYDSSNFDSSRFLWNTLIATGWKVL